MIDNKPAMVQTTRRPLSEPLKTSDRQTISEPMIMKKLGTSIHWPLGDVEISKVYFSNSFYQMIFGVLHMNYF